MNPLIRGETGGNVITTRAFGRAISKTYQRVLVAIQERLRQAVTGSIIAISMMAICSCAHPPPLAPPVKIDPEIQVLRPGDVIKVAFPGSPQLEISQQIRRDGRINLFLIGEVKAAEKSPSQLEEELVKLYASQLVSKEVRVTVITSAFYVFVTGAVMHPGKLTPDHALTAFEAIMEAGGFDNDNADSKHVKVIRYEDGQAKTYPLDMKAVLNGKPSEPFYLKSGDTVVVPAKFKWF